MSSIKGSSVLNTFTKHGVFLAIFNKGVLLQGPSGIGKSECALALLDKGHQLIADDAPLFYQKNDKIMGTSPEGLAHLLEVRGLGIVDVPLLFGNQAVLTEKTLDLIIAFSPAHHEDDVHARVLKPKLDEEIILGVRVPKLSLSLIFSKNMAIFTETAVRLVFSPSSPRIERLLKCD